MAGRGPGGAEAAREIEARRSGVHTVTADERVAIEEGLSEVERGEVVSEQDIQAFWTRLGA